MEVVFGSSSRGRFVGRFFAGVFIWVIFCLRFWGVDLIVGVVNIGLFFVGGGGFFFKDLECVLWGGWFFKEILGC